MAHKSKKAGILAIFLAILAIIIVVNGYYGKNTKDILTSAIQNSEKDETKNTSSTANSPTFALSISNTEEDNKSGGTYDFGLVKAGSVLKGKNILTLIDPVKSTFSINLLAASQFEEAENVKNWLEKNTKSTLNFNGKKNEQQDVNFKINLPEKLLPGEYTLALQAVLEDYEGFKLSKGASRVKTASGITIKFAIEGKRHYEMELVSANYNPDLLETNKELNATIQYNNLGNAKLFPSATLKIIKDKTAIAEEELKFNQCLAFTGCASNITHKFENINTFDKINAEINLYYAKKEGGEKKQVAKITLQHYIMPWKWIQAGALILLALIIFVFFRRGRKLFLISGSIKYTIQPGDNLEKISTMHNADSKKIILINKLKVPYQLVPASSIFIPINSLKK